MQRAMRVAVWLLMLSGPVQEGVAVCHAGLWAVPVVAVPPQTGPAGGWPALGSPLSVLRFFVPSLFFLYPVGSMGVALDCRFLFYA